MSICFMICFITAAHSNMGCWIDLDNFPDLSKKDNLHGWIWLPLSHRFESSDTWVKIHGTKAERRTVKWIKDKHNLIGYISGTSRCTDNFCFMENKVRTELLTQFNYSKVFGSVLECTLFACWLTLVHHFSGWVWVLIFIITHPSTLSN